MNRRITVLQTVPLATWVCRHVKRLYIILTVFARGYFARARLFFNV